MVILKEQVEDQGAKGASKMKREQIEPVLSLQPSTTTMEVRVLERESEIWVE